MLIFISLIIIILCLYLIHRKFTHWNRHNVKQLPINLLFGNVSGFILKKIPLYEFNKKSYQECKLKNYKYAGFYLLTKPVLMVRDLQLIKRILISDFEYFTDRVLYINKKIDPLSDNLLAMKGLEWKHMREKLTPAYTPNKLKNMFPVLQNIGDQLKLTLDKAALDSEIINFQDITSKYVVDAIVNCIFGVECNTLRNLNKEFEYHAKKVLGGSAIQKVKTVISAFYPCLLDYFNVPFNSQEIQNFYVNMTKQIVDYREENNIIRKDLMHSLIQMRNNIDINKEEKLNNLQKSASKSLTIEEIAAELMIFFAAGYETTSTVITFIVYELICNVEIQDKLRKEVNQVLRKQDGKLSYQALMEMSYMDMCLNETTRKYTVVEGISRVCTKTYKIPDGDSIIAAGSQIMIPAGQIHHDPDYYPNPEKFDPERFSPENKSKLFPFAFFPFSQGPRQCIGTRLAMLKIKFFLATLLSNYTFTLSSKTSMPMEFHKSNAVLTFKDILYIQLEKM